MKKHILFVAAALISAAVMGQTGNGDITSKNSWLKAGLNAGVPVGDLSNVSNFTLGLDLKGQIMSTNHVGVGITTGYNHFFAKDNYSDFGTIPLGAFIRYYPQSTGFFVGADLGYSFITGADGATGGVYVRPQVGYHNYDWNVFGFYNGVFRSNTDGGNIQYAGIGATYNIRFK